MHSDHHIHKCPHVQPALWSMPGKENQAKCSLAYQASKMHQMGL